MTDQDQSENVPRRAPLPDAWWGLSVEQRRLVAGGVAAVLALVLVIAISALVGGDDEAEAFVADLAPERVATWDRLAQCESEGRWDLVSDNGYEGGLQFSMASWLEVGGEGSPAAASREEQIMRGEFLHEKQGWGAWPACSAELGLDG